MKSLKIILLLWLFFWGCFVSPSPSLEANIKYDVFFKRWGEFYMPFHHYKWFKSQGVAESNLNPLAVSKVGAMGIMQLMPATAKDMGVSDPFDPEMSIQGGIKYDQFLWNRVKDRDIMFASYNAGIGNIYRAKQLACEMKWSKIAEYLPFVTGRHSEETINYVKRINRTYLNM